MEKRTGISLHGNVDISHVKSTEPHDMTVKHYHEGYEIYFQADGSRILFLKDTQYLLKKGDIAVMLPYELHYGESAQQTYYERYTVNFKETYLETVLGEEGKSLLSGLHTGVMTLPKEQSMQMEVLFQDLYSRKKKRNVLDEKIFCCELVLILSRIADFGKEQETQTHRLPSTLICAIDYINDHYEKTLTLDEIAAQSHLDKYYLSHLFKKNMGISVMNYLTHVRVQKAYHYLNLPDMSVEQAAQKSGFANYGAMERSFEKIYAATPMQIKQKEKNKKDNK
jgi:YesN/AraC family two-component response regulator